MPLIDPRPMREHLFFGAYCATIGGLRAVNYSGADLRELAIQAGVDAITDYEANFGRAPRMPSVDDEDAPGNAHKHSEP